MQELIGRCRAEGVELEVRAGGLEVYFDDEPSAALLALLKQNKQQLVAFLEAAPTAGEGGAPVPRLRNGEALPLSFGQQRLWLVDQVDGGSPQYNLFNAFEFEGAFDEDTAQAAFDVLVARHEPLRTVFAEAGGVPCQVVRDEWTLELVRHDLGRLDAAARAPALAAAIAAEAVHVFDLARDLMLRVVCVRTGADSGVLMINVHHIAADGWSLAILVDEFVRLYRQFSGGEDAALAPLPLAYADYAAWQRDSLTGDALERHLAYWERHLHALPQVHDFPLDTPRSAQQSNRGASVAGRIGQEQLAALGTLAAGHGATLFMALHAVLSVVLARYCRSSDVVIGTPVANRGRAELETLVGFFANTLVLRTEVDADASFATHLERVRDINLDAQEHQDVPFELLVERLNPVRSRAHAPLFQVMFALNSVPAGTLALPGLTLRPLAPAAAAAKFDLGIGAVPAGGALDLRIDYNADLFDAATIERLLGHLLATVDAVTGDPHAPVARLRMSGEAELRALLAAPAAGATLPDGLTLHRLFEQQAAAQPEALAVECGADSVTYAELNRRANRLARHLRARGAGADMPVGVCVERSIGMVTALLAVLKAGAAYLPLDPGYPAARLRYMLEDSGATLVVTESHLAGMLGLAAGAALCLDQDAIQRMLDRTDGTDLAPLPGLPGAALAYVIYTSGSTGRPKGVMIEHRNVVHLLDAAASLTGGAGAVWLGLTAVSFDISVLEIFGALTSGARLVIAPEHSGQAGSALDFSLFYFASSAGADGADLYRLLLEGAKFADDNGFAAVWTPERHFAAFGGVFPNPAVTGAAVAAVTRRVQVRAGSCVLPLNDPLKVAEDWSVVDNLSNGRVGLAFASGWNPNDFVLAPDRFKTRHQVLFDGVDTFSAFWSGRPVRRVNGAGAAIDVKLYPAPVQAMPPIWITAAGHPDTFRSAGARGANVLTHLLGQTMGELAEKIGEYRQAWRAAGHPGKGKVSLMLHTFIADSDEQAMAEVRQPFKDYLATSLALINGMRAEVEGGDRMDTDAILELAVNRYFKSAALFGSSERCAAIIDELTAIGVDEIACLVDFGVPADTVLASLPKLAALKDSIGARPRGPAPAVGELIARHGVTHLQCTPSRAAMLLADEADRAALAGLHTMLVGGEACSAALAGQLAQATAASLHNMYGPTEATVWASSQTIGAGMDEVPLGIALAHYRLHVVDRFLELAPLGVPGELLISGAGVARGYLRRTELTAERFVEFQPDPAQPAVRAYRTGDLVRYRADGRLQFLGRIDHQVKLRGFRIELGEIEAQLMACSGVTAAAALVRDFGADDQRVVAYVAGRSLDGAALRTQLAQVLPGYMVPSEIVVMDALPQTANGKLDRNALPAPGVATEAAVARVAPSTPTERALAEVWTALLKVDPALVGAEANFFELGGHSLLLMRLAAEIRERFGVDLSIREVFELPTLAKLADRIDRQARQMEEAERFGRMQARSRDNEQEVVL
ncbi:LLM class flavin-dependent oxidoreductase [Massilia forsythiae]|uniref:LLM class flavin-dependent oxidoreductase n=1 Tax=Massilia forsythiae TaxID=2728020 RepID=A0A7Z2ZTQ8_9BURK|nr:MupA/Atu3671 family FMN-dependent luciferase-like monooxygenase [Massilia forsythiae]QJE01525.1 LLM class flavin-dependent oxidoreductase [Massilia forsythiae]